MKSKKGYLKSDNKAKASIPNKQFQSMFTRENLPICPDKGYRPYPRIYEIKIEPK